MKKKLRKITVDNLDYVYRVTDKYHPETGTNTLTVKIFLSDHKQTPLVVEFHTIYHYAMGQPLNTGVSLPNKKTNLTEGINLNHPKYIRALILYGIKNGWKGTNRIETLNGLEYLTDLGFDVGELIPQWEMAQESKEPMPTP